MMQNGRYAPGFGKLKKQLAAAGIAVIVLENEDRRQLEKLMEEQGLHLTDGLMIAALDETIQLAKELKMAVVAYENPAFPNEERFRVQMLIQDWSDIDVTLLERWWQRRHGRPWNILETDRCYVREIAISDLDALFRLYEQEGMVDYMEPLYERDEEEAYQRAYIANMYGFYGYGMWLVFEKGTNTLIGRAGLEHREIDGTLELEMGYAIAGDFQKKGLATEVCCAIVSYAKEHLTYDRVNCLIKKENKASVALVNRLGFKSLGTVFERGQKFERYVLELGA